MRAPAVRPSAAVLPLLPSLILLLPALAAAQTINAPASYTVGNQRTGVQSAPFDLMVHNDGAAALHIVGLSLSGMHAADFGLVTMPTMGMPLIVAPGGSAVVQFTFKPGANGMRTAFLTVFSNDPLSPQVTVTLFGNGVYAGFMMAPTGLTFPRTRTGECSAAQFVRIDNPGTDNLRVSAISFGGAAASSFRTAATPFTVPARGAGFIDVSLCPRGIGMLAATLVVSTDLMAGHKAEVMLSATAFGPVIELDRDQVDFGDVYAGTSSAPAAVTIRNPGDDATVIASVLLSGGDTGQFSLSAPMPDTRLDGGNALKIDLTARPADAGPRKTELVITLKEELVPGRQLRVPLFANGVVSTIETSPMSIDCGTHFVGVTTRCRMDLTVRNTGQRVLEGLQVSPNLADFRAESVPAQIMPMQSARIPITFRPVTSGDRRGTLVLRAKGLLTMPQVTVNGKGQGVALQLSPQLLDFGTIELGAGPTTRQLLVLNNGDADVEIEAVMDPMSPAAAEFVVEPAAATLTPGEPQSITVRFQPTMAGEKQLGLQLQLKGGGTLLETIEVQAKAYEKLTRPASGCAVGGRPGVAGFGLLALLLTLGIPSRGLRRFPTRRKTW